jgi:hypothetical protein
MLKKRPNIVEKSPKIVIMTSTTQIRENRRLSQIRMSTKGGRKSSGTPRGSDAASVADATLPTPEVKGPPKAETSQTAFYIGVVFILLGFLIIFSSMISRDRCYDGNAGDLFALFCK